MYCFEGLDGNLEKEGHYITNRLMWARTQEYNIIVAAMNSNVFTNNSLLQERERLATQLVIFNIVNIVLKQDCVCTRIGPLTGWLLHCTVGPIYKFLGSINIPEGVECNSILF